VTIIVMANVNFFNFTCKSCVNVFPLCWICRTMCHNKGGVSFTPIFAYAEGLYFIIIASMVHSGNEPL